MENRGTGLRYLKSFCISAVLAAACDDRAAAVDALCERRSPPALREVHLLVSAAAGGRDSGDVSTAVSSALLC